MPSIRTNGISVYYEVYGKGEPLLVIVGLSIDLTAVEGILSELSKKYQVIAFDNRGAGRSDKPDAPYTIGMMADDASGLVGGLGVKQANVLGISMGGRIAMSLALKHPEQVKSLILASTGPRAPRGLGRRLLFLVLEIPRQIGARGKKYPQPRYAYLRQRSASHGFDATGSLGQIRVPTLILHGRSDRIAPFRWAEEMHDLIAGSKMVAFEGGHMLLFRRQKEFIDAVEEFLDSR